ncbi:carbon-phosphorus lyase complex subunit PhnI [Cohnella sp.]|uniref:carbon-phosphorus lyase complex subunit PhnI n=1 Tax=Cohnella sp. TaxID=1883426 RepID=UPI003563A323
MAYVAVTGGQEAIQQAEKLVKYYRTKDSSAVLDVSLIEKQLRLLVDRIMGEGGMYAPEYAALALKQAEGDPSEAAFLVRAYRSTLPRNHYSLMSDPANMRVIRRISSSFRDMPGGQVLGPTCDYTHRMLNFSLRNESTEDLQSFVKQYLSDEVWDESSMSFTKIADLLRDQNLMAAADPVYEEEPYDMTRQKLTFPCSRSARLQCLSRGETGAMTSLAYSSMRGYGVVHPTIGELRVGYTPVYIPHPFGNDEDGEGIYIGEVMMTEVESINSFTQDKESGKVQFLLGYGLVFGQNELKAIAMSILERSLETEGTAPAQDEEFVLTHIDSVESGGFVSHLKLPHYITFQTFLDQIRKTQTRKAKETTEEALPDAGNGQTEVQYSGV